MRCRARVALTSGRRRGSLLPERWTRAIVCCLAREDGQGFRSARQPRISRPLYGIRPTASKGPEGRPRRVLQNPHSWVQIPSSPLGNTRHRQATPDDTSWGLPRVVRAVDSSHPRFTLSTAAGVDQTGFAGTSSRCSPGPSRAIGVSGALPGSISLPSDLPPILVTWGVAFYN